MKDLAKQDTFHEQVKIRVKIQETVVKPMIEEMLEMRNETDHYKALYFQNIKDL